MVSNSSAWNCPSEDFIFVGLIHVVSFHDSDSVVVQFSSPLEHSFSGIKIISFHLQVVPVSSSFQSLRFGSSVFPPGGQSSTVSKSPSDLEGTVGLTGKSSLKLNFLDSGLKGFFSGNFNLFDHSLKMSNLSFYLLDDLRMDLDCGCNLFDDFLNLFFSIFMFW